MELSGKQVIVVGLGKSGISAARLCVAQGARVVGTDAAPREKLGSELSTLGIDIVAGGHSGVRFSEADLIVVSPGVPRLPELALAESSGVPVVGELELSSRFLRAPVIAVGGTNGKSTTTMLVFEIAKAAGKRVFAGANLGTPACDAAVGDWELVVFEVSSFQMERVPTFRPRASILLNVSEDHLDRYDSYQDYARAKGNAFVNQLPEDYAIVPNGDAVCLEQARRGHGSVVTFGPGGDYDTEGRSVTERATGSRVSLDGVELHGRHNIENAAAAIAATRALGISLEAVRAGLSAFRPLGHRMALVAEVDGVRFYDDSKGTNVGAAVTALSGLMEERAVLIAGGRDKHGSYQPLVDALAEKGRALVLIGEAAPRIAEAVGERLPVVRATNMDEAVSAAARLAQPGDAVLLSPACSSFDMFGSYSERGDRFAEAVRRRAAASEQQEVGA